MSLSAGGRPAVELLRDVPMFAGLDDDDLSRLALMLTEKHYPKDSVVVSAQDDKGFWAASVRMDNEEELIWGIEVEQVTSNRLYIIAAAEAMNVLPDGSDVHIYTTSDYLRNGASGWKWG